MLLNIRVQHPDCLSGILKILQVASACALCLAYNISLAQSGQGMPIADAHMHYSHDSVEMTPPERVIELMREANLKFALVSSSDDNGTQLLSDLAPDLIVPGLRPYRRRGELGSWFTDQGALDYVLRLLETNRYASIGEFHIFGKDADLEIPRKIVQLAAQYNLVLHAHSDADAVERLLAQDPTVKVIWAHSGFDEPEEIARMLGKHDRLWADLAFRSEVGSGGSLSDDWVKLFTDYPDRMMLGTDTYTPERMYYIPDHAKSARVWLASLPPALAEKVAWKNAYDLLMPVWHKNRQAEQHENGEQTDCNGAPDENVVVLEDGDLSIRLQPIGAVSVSEAFSMQMTLCGKSIKNAEVSFDADMPAHGHGMNYTPESTLKRQSDESAVYQLDGIVHHMPGQWRWQVDVLTKKAEHSLTHEFNLQ